MGKSILHFWVLLLAISIQVVGISLSHAQISYLAAIISI